MSGNKDVVTLAMNDHKTLFTIFTLTNQFGDKLKLLLFNI